jgi:hypothetical protein
MLSFAYISELVHGLLVKDGIKDFPLKHVKKLIEYRNKMLNIFQLEDFNWYRLPKSRKSKRTKDELYYRESVYINMREDFKYDGITIRDEVIDKVFSYERIILTNVGNVKSYYIILEELKKRRKVDFLLEWEFRKWTKWQESISEAVEQYILDYGVYPNAFIANSHTLSQINFLINNIPGGKKEVYRRDEKTYKKIPVDENEEIELAGLENNLYTLRFGYNENVKDKEFMLFYQDHPDLDDDDDDDDENNNDKTPVSPTPVGSEIPVKVS